MTLFPIAISPCHLKADRRILTYLLSLLAPSFLPSLLPSLPSSLPSCAIGEAVLDIIKEERLQENALKTGAYLKGQLRERLLLPWPSVIGDVRGLGLFLGVECIEGTEEEEEEEEEEAVEEGNNKERGEDEDKGVGEVPIPSSEAAGWIAAWAREEGVQLSVDGPAANVLKIKPPLCFRKEEADLLVATLERAVGEYMLMKRKTRGKEGGRKG